MSTLNVKMIDRDTQQPIPYGPLEPRLNLAFGSGGWDDAAFRHYCDGAGSVSIELLPDGIYTAWLEAKGYELTPKPILMPRDGAGQLTFDLVRLAPPAGASAHQAGKLEPHGPILLAGSQAWRWLGCSAFALPMLHAAGENIDPFLDWVIAAGFNTLRCFFAFHYIPSQMGRPDFIATPDQTRAFLEKLATRQIRCEWTCGDMQIVKPGIGEQLNWYSAQADVLKDFDLVTVETANEPFKNGVDVSAIGRLGHGIIQASGNYNPPCQPVLDYATDHTPRDDEWPRKGKELYDLYEGWPELPGGVRVPWVSDEPMGADETNQPGKRSNVPNDFFDDGACVALMGAGGTFHCTDAIFGRVPGPTQQTCASAYIAGASSFVADVATGQYTRGGLNDCPLEHDDANALRTFVRLRGNRADAVVIRPKDSNRVARNGWHVVSTSGPDNRIVVLAR